MNRFTLSFLTSSVALVAVSQHSSAQSLPPLLEEQAEIVRYQKVISGRDHPDRIPASEKLR